MNARTKNRVRIGWALLISLALGEGHWAMAGWTGQMNGAGFGRAGVNVTSRTGSFGAANSPYMVSPAAAMPPSLPLGAAAPTAAQVKGFPGYVWSASTVASGGDKTDNPEIEGRITISPALFASITLTSTATFGETGKSGTIKVNASATAGTAMLMRGFEVPDWRDVPEDNPDTLVDETLEYLKTNGVLIFDMLLSGPFELTDEGPGDCNSLIIPFTIKTGPTNLFFATDGLGVSNGTPVPGAAVQTVPGGIAATLSVTDDRTPIAEVDIWIHDSLTPSFKAGPFKAGNKILVRQHSGLDPISTTRTGYTAAVRTKGQAFLVAVDDEGGATPAPGVPLPAP